MAMWEDLVTSEQGGKKFKFQQPDAADLALFNSEEDRVQGLSGTDMLSLKRTLCLKKCSKISLNRWLVL
jgi:hypothetical protein